MNTHSQQPTDQHPQKDVKQNASVPSDTMENALFSQGHMNQVTPHNILQLQRLIGNQKVQRLMPARQAVVRPAQRIQRAKKDDPTREDKGLMESNAPERFVQKIFAFTSDPQNADEDVMALKDVMQESLNAELAHTGVPHVDVSFTATGSERAWFFREDWKIDIQVMHVFGSSINRLSDLTEDQIEQAVGTVYHEGRHAEQFFRIAQLHVTELLQKDTDRDEIKSKLVSQLEMPERIIEAAIANPLDANTNRRIVKDIKLWDRSRFGEDSQYRNLVVYGMEQDGLTPLLESTQAFLDLMPEGYVPLPDEQLEQLKLALAVIDQRQEQLEDYQQNTLQPELERVQAVDNPRLKANNKTMIEHLSKLLTLVNTLRAYRPLPSEPYAAAVMAYEIRAGITDIEAELVKAYFDLPLEEDAATTGREAEESMDERHNQQYVP